MYKYLLVLLLSFSTNALATDLYDPATNILNINSVILNGVQYNNVVIQLTGFNVISVGSSAPVNINDKCSESNFNATIFNAIAPGMTMGNVMQLIGCQYDPNGIVRAQDWVLYQWNDLASNGNNSIGVYFNVADNVVTSSLDEYFKLSIGF